MRKQVVILVIAVALLVLSVAFIFRHRRTTPRESALVPNTIQSPKRVPVEPVKVIAPAPMLSQAPDRIVYGDRRDSDVSFATVQDIVNLQKDIWSRQKAVRVLPKNMNPETRKLLTDFLGTWHEEDENQNGQVLKNDMMEALVSQTVPSSVLFPLFTAIYNDEKQNLVIRDYAVQHLAILSERLDQPSGWAPAKIQAQKSDIEKALWRVVDEDRSSIFGTALLGLIRISENDPNVDRQRLGQAALKAASSLETQEAARITAFQVCAQLHMNEILPLATEVAQNDSSTMVRISAIGTLGLIGDSSQTPILEQIAQANPRLKPVVTAALQRIQENQ